MISHESLGSVIFKGIYVQGKGSGFPPGQQGRGVLNCASMTITSREISRSAESWKVNYRSASI